MVSLTAALVKVARAADRWRCGARLEPAVLLGNSFAQARRGIITTFLIVFDVILRGCILLDDANYTNYISLKNGRKGLAFIPTIIFEINRYI